MAFKRIGIEIEWVGEGLKERGLNKKNGTVLVEVDSSYFRPSDVDFLLGDPSKAKAELGWEPKIKFSELVDLMVDFDLMEVDEFKRKNMINQFLNFKQ